MVYRFRATIPGNKIFVREYEVKGNSSLYSFHLFLQNDLSFAPDQMVMFRGTNNVGKIKSEYGLFDMGDGTLDSVKVEDVVRKGENSLFYVYDLFKDRSILLEFQAEEEESPRRSYPRLVMERGKNPDQFSDNYDDFDNLAVEMGDNDSMFSNDELPEGEE